MEATVCLNDKTDDSFEGFTLETRQEVDFTDQLWLVLSRAQSYLELTEAFSAVFQAIIQGRGIFPCLSCLFDRIVLVTIR